MARFSGSVKEMLTGLAIVVSLLLLAAPPASAAGLSTQASPVMLANVYRPGLLLADYWVSEKYDGVRGYWDGRRLMTRGGEPVMAPPWFTAGWPVTPMDGELWAGRGQFQKAVSTVRQQTPDDTAWRAIRFMVFDLPGEPGPFSQRLSALRAVVAHIDRPWVIAVVQTRATTHAALMATMRQVVAGGGEGVMLHRGASLYQALRNDDLLKVKPHDDAEARVLAYVPGKGRFVGLMGALRVETIATATQPARQFKLGTGFSDAERRQPPAIGSLVTFRYRGFNDSGLPRFASFLRVREDN